MPPRAAWALAAAPLLAALIALAVVFLTGFSQRDPLADALGERFYGFFLDRYPLFAFALVYGLARLVTVALAPGRASPLIRHPIDPFGMADAGIARTLRGLPRRLIGLAIGVALLLAASLHPTFGGMVLRAGFGTGSGAFLEGWPMIAAYLMGAAAAALLFGLALGLGTVIIGSPGARARTARSRPRRIGRALGGWVTGFLALWLAAAVIGLARDAGFGPWPRRALDGRDLVVAAALLTAAALPHMLSVAARLRKTGDDRSGME